MAETYIEHINRFVVEHLEDYTDREKAEMRLNGLDPDNYWQLHWSFETQKGADEKLQWYKDSNFRGTYRVRDLGGPIAIERTIGF